MPLYSGRRLRSRLGRRIFAICALAASPWLGCSLVHLSLGFCAGLPPRGTSFSGPRAASLSARWASTSNAAVVDRPEETVAVSGGQSARKVGFALMLDDGVRKSHSMAQNSQFITGFFKGLGNPKSYSELLTSLYFVYEAMEIAFDATRDEHVRAMDFPELRRLPALEEDMVYFHGANWRTTITPSPATVRYCEQIREVASKDPLLLIGHQYSRYVGDLFGGQMMSYMAVKSLGLEKDGPGTGFYRFPDIANTNDFIEKWYGTLNRLGLDDTQKKAIVDEANDVFKLNIDILEELDGSAVAAVWQFFVASLKDRLGLA